MGSGVAVTVLDDVVGDVVGPTPVSDAVEAMSRRAVTLLPDRDPDRPQRQGQGDGEGRPRGRPSPAPHPSGAGPGARHEGDDIDLVPPQAVGER